MNGKVIWIANYCVRLPILIASLCMLGIKGPEDTTSIGLVIAWAVLLGIQILSFIIYPNLKIFQITLSEGWAYMFCAAICIMVQSPEKEKNTMFIILISVWGGVTALPLVLVCIAACIAGLLIQNTGIANPNTEPLSEEKFDIINEAMKKETEKLIKRYNEYEKPNPQILDQTNKLMAKFVV